MKVISAYEKNLGDGFLVKRVLPHLETRSIGPFVFVDHFGPVPIKTGNELVVRPHPHIGLATVTYLYAGLVLHKDSLGTEKLIRPGEVNWMTAGRGIVHSEHSQLETQRHMQMEGIQIWVALPRAHEDIAPAFDHYEAALLPQIDLQGARVRVIAGSGFGQTSPVKILSPLYYWDIELQPNGTINLNLHDKFENAIYVAHGSLEIMGNKISAGQMVILGSETTVTLSSTEATRAALIGGEPLAEPRHLWWNFVSSSWEKIDRAKHEWRENRMGIVPGELDRIPLPE